MKAEASQAIIFRDPGFSPFSQTLALNGEDGDMMWRTYVVLFAMVAAFLAAVVGTTVL
jgi:hypothetical protein